MASSETKEVLKQLLVIFPEESIDRYNVLVGLPELKAIFQRHVPKWLLGEALSPISDYLSVKDILACREICKLWHWDIHNLIVNHPYYKPYNKINCLENDVPINTSRILWKSAIFRLATSTPVLRFRTTDSIDSFIQMSKSTKFVGGPMFGCMVYLNPSVHSSNPRQLFERSTEQLLNTFGNSVKHLILSTDRYFETAEDFIKRLRIILQLTPNLHSLTVYFGDQTDTQLQSLILPRRPLPRLPYLEYVRFDGSRSNSFYNIFDAVFSLVVRQESRVNKLVLPLLMERRFEKQCCYSYLSKLKVRELELIAEFRLPCNLNKLSELDRFYALKGVARTKNGPYSVYIEKLLAIPTLQKVRFRKLKMQDFFGCTTTLPDESKRCYSVIDVELPI